MLNKRHFLSIVLAVITSFSALAQGHPSGEEETLLYAQFISPSESHIISHVPGADAQLVYELTYPSELDGLLMSPQNGLYYLFDNVAHVYEGGRFVTVWVLPEVATVDDLVAQAADPAEWDGLTGTVLLNDIVLSSDERFMAYDMTTIDEIGRFVDEFIAVYEHEAELFRLIEIEDRNLNSVHKIDNLRWSPDGTTLAYAYPTQDRLDTEHITLVAGCTVDVMVDCAIERLNLPAERPFMRTFDWSPDGERFAYACNDTHLASHDICIMDRDGTLLSEYITTEKYKFDLTWSPDGQFLAYAAHPPGSQEQDIYLLNLETGEEINFSDTPGVLDSTPFWWRQAE